MSIDFASPDFLADPYSTYRELRESGPYWLPHTGPLGGMWLFTSYDSVHALLREAHTSKTLEALEPGTAPSPLEGNLLNTNPPDHTRLRSLASRAFTNRSVRELEPRIREISDDLLDAVEGKGEMDFIADFAMPLPVIVIAELLGVPPEDRNEFRGWSNDMMAGIDAIRVNEETAAKAQESGMALAAYLMDLIARRRAEPQDDLISALIEARDVDDQLSEGELLSMCTVLLVAGHETTVNLFGNGLLALLHHPAELSRLRENRDLLPSAVEEMLRYDAPVQRATFRVTTDPIEIGGARIEAGQQVSAVIGAANRDPDQFNDPDVLDITRDPNRHLAFGQGIHFCLGAPLARAEARIGFDRFLDRIPRPGMRDPSPDWGPSTWMRGLKTLPIVF